MFDSHLLIKIPQITYNAQDFDDSVLIMNNHLAKDSPQETLFKMNDPLISSE